MANIDYLKLSKVRADGKAEISVRFLVNRTFRPQFSTGLFIAPERFINLDESSRCRNYKIDIPKQGKLNFVEVKELQDINIKLREFLTRIQKICDEAIVVDKSLLTKEWLDNAIRVIVVNEIPNDKITFKLIQDKLSEEKQNKLSNTLKKITFLSLMDEYLAKKEFSYDYDKGMRVLMRTLSRWEAFRKISDKSFILDIDKLTKDDIEDFRDYLKNEYKLSLEHPKIFEKLLSDYPLEITIKHKSPKLVERGDNSIIKLMKKFKAFMVWCNDNDKTQNKPFARIKIGTETFGTPYYITLEERNKIADYDLSNYPSLEVQRDIFIFQCCIGCRVGDLLRMTDANLINGCIEYVPNKTKDEKPITVNVPLNDRASALVKKYKGKSNKLFPFISSQKYNEAIKEIFTICEVTRMVTILNPTTGEEEKKPINELASSHLARRTFVGNLYKQVKDPNLIGKLSGHAEGSKAFARYRDIDADMKKELVNLID